MGKAPFSHLCISITSLVKSENSSDLGMGPGPKLESDEYSDFTKLVIELP